MSEFHNKKMNIKKIYCLDVTGLKIIKIISICADASHRFITKYIKFF